MAKPAFPSSRSNPGIVEVRETASVPRRVNESSPADSRALAILCKTKGTAQGKVYVRERLANFCFTWNGYYAEIRGSFAMFYDAGRCPRDDEYDLPGLYAVCCFRGYEQEVLRIHGRGDVLQLRDVGRGGSLFIHFEDKEVLNAWHGHIAHVAEQLRLTPDDFDVISPIGAGAGGKVFVVRRKGFSETLAMKVIDKKSIFRDSYHFRHAIDERVLLELVEDGPCCIETRYCFQTASRLYYVMEFCEGGDIFSYMWGRKKAVGEETAKYVAAQVLLALEYIHSVGFLYRDLKPENILIDSRGFVRVTDFGLSKKMPVDVRSRTGTICGTYAYLSPEMLSGRYNASVDVWAFGIFLYQLIMGVAPYEARSVEDARRYFRRGNPVVYNSEAMSKECISLLRGILNPSANRRLGCGEGGIGELKSHEFFSGVDWEGLKSRDDEAAALDVNYINRSVQGAPEEAQQLGRNFDLDYVSDVRFEDESSSAFGGDWAFGLPLVHWMDKCRDLSPLYLLGFDYAAKKSPDANQ